MTSPAPLPAGMASCRAYDASGTGRDLAPEEVPAVLEDDDGGFVWMGLYEPDQALMSKVQAWFGLHPLAVEDAHKAHQRPKLEAYGESLFIATHTAQERDKGIVFGETHIFLGKRYLLTVRHDESTSYAPVRTHAEKHPELLRLGPSYGLYSVLDFIVDNLLPLIDQYQGELNALEDAVFDETYSRDTIKRLYRLKRQLTRMRLAVAPLQDILGQLVNLHPDLVRREMRLHFRDVLDHAVRINEAIDTLREMVTAAMSTNLALVNVRQNEIVKRLAGWAALIAVPTLVASWYGMNFEHMPELAGRFSYHAVVVVTAALAGGVFVLLRRARWL
ncbi:magnesium/cobalt transporter CorA [Alkalisalibacterium limincola]|uniref:Magnesium transport protein CorA n=1 Tax=Alkalisalibacterium limincola TaxID=2699169 RepID=A0A5C8KSX1_9GAMM|nr:magnesium/cobalt transporter CorA [Alkalisalibacterium limincola]TXK62576.1 magnesium/cobalt transporter CorA [Alkalisalibacterium limincola]